MVPWAKRQKTSRKEYGGGPPRWVWTFVEEVWSNPLDSGEACQVSQIGAGLQSLGSWPPSYV